MRRYCLPFLILAALVPLRSASGQTVCPSASGESLRTCIRIGYTPSQVLSLDQSKDTLYAVVDVTTSGGQSGVVDAYTNRFVPFDASPNADPSQDVFNGGSGQDTINQEHLWPRSQGTSGNDAESDLHHLFSVHSGTNGARSNDLFGEVDDSSAAWYFDGIVGAARPVLQADQDLCSERGGGVFEPPEAIKGDIARALFYVAVIYEADVSASFLTQQQATLLAWHDADPASSEEIARMNRIETYQGNTNPFIDDATLASRVLAGGSGGGGGGSTTGTIVIAEVADPQGSGNFVGEFVELYNAGSSAANLDGWTLVQASSTQTTTLDASSLQSGTLTLAAGAYAVVGRGSASDFSSVHGALPAVYFSEGNTSTRGAPQINGDESYVLFDASGDPVDYFGEEGGFEVGSSSRYQRIFYPSQPGTAAMAWLADDSAPTPGSANDFVLPVELTRFTASLGGDAVTLRWETASERGNSGFVVEHRRIEHRGHQGGFAPLGFVAGAGTTTEAQRYRYDVQALSPGTHAFRLRQVDYDGAVSYSAEVEVTVSEQGAVLGAPYPNPARGVVTIPVASGVEQAEVFDVLGRRVAVLESERGVLRWDATDVPPGVYFVRSASRRGLASTAVTVER